MEISGGMSLLTAEALRLLMVVGRWREEIDISSSNNTFDEAYYAYVKAKNYVV